MGNKTMKTNIAVTGYYGTGSSAIMDLIREYDCARVVPYEDKNYEHVVFYVSGGLFNLCTLLTHGNAPLTSDMVINNFISAMERLDKYDLVWFGSYSKQFGDGFRKLYMGFVDGLSTSKKEKNLNHVVKSRYSFVKALLQVAAHLILKRKFVQYGTKYIYDGRNVYFSMPTEEEVYSAAKEFTNGYFNLFDEEGVNVRVFDHLIWANQVDEYARCFDDDFRVIVAERDPRDVYLLNKYVWFKPPIGHGLPHFPTEPKAFVEEWNKTVVREYSGNNVRQIHFEDLIYRYDETVKEIEAYVGLNEKQHNDKGKKLDISRSIENTQVFNVKKEWAEEVKIIEKELSEFLYHFPYERTPDVGNMFDDPRTVKGKK